MGALNDMHEEFLATSLEDPDYFGKPITFKTRDAVTEYTVHGSINRIQPKMGEGVGTPQPLGKSVGIGVRHTRLMEKAGYPAAGWEDFMPTKDWLVVCISPWTEELETYTMEIGNASEDGTLGIDSIWLTEYTAV